MNAGRNESVARVKLAARVLLQVRYHSGQPLLQSEIARLRFFAECEEEAAAPLEKLAITIIERERTRMGYPPQSASGFTGRN